MKRTIDFELIKWKNMPDRLPLIIRGARQVGKSYAIEKLGREHFKSLVIINFEYQPEFISCFESLDPTKIISKLEIFTNSNIKSGETLLFLDEIQQCPQAILALRYFKEKMPQLHVIAAGSLLEFVIHDTKFSFPVGRVQFMHMHPLSFSEFLLALDQDKLLKTLKDTSLANPLDSAIHIYALNFVKQYFLIGGMPAAIQNYINNNSYLECQNIQSALMQTYRSDFGKYATKTQHKYLERLFEMVPKLILEHFKYSKVDPNLRARELQPALEQLCWAGLIKLVKQTSASGLPLEAQVKENKFKLLFLDIGLVQNASQIEAKTILENDILQINAGLLAEQFVGQELICLANPYEEKRLYFWERDKKNSQAEVDYVTNIGGKIVPIEVKSGKTGRLKSIKQFMEEKNSPLGIRFSTHPLSLENNILSVPFYLISHINRLITDLFS